MTEVEVVTTPFGDARVTWQRAERPRAVVALGHGASTGIEAPDLRALAATLPPLGFSVALIEQPWRVAGGYGESDTTTLDTGWRAVCQALDLAGAPLVTGGRSAGSRVAGRTAVELAAVAVLALSFPLHAPGRQREIWDPSELLGTGLPTLIVQGARDPFGLPEEFPPLPARTELVSVPAADHVFSAWPDQADTITRITDAVATWLGTVTG
ncbi:MAG TPA: alpha/beta family hydrolase [Pseudonocardiaceae bacterium]|jgi:hypothetical protein|nr:alpha/beta family hydrolase [Pseudonocardiaceae bacterium]